MENFKIIQKLESTNSRILKEEILLHEMKNKNDHLFNGMKLAYNKLVTFGVKKYQNQIKTVLGFHGKSLNSFLQIYPQEN